MSLEVKYVKKSCLAHEPKVGWLLVRLAFTYLQLKIEYLSHVHPQQFLLIYKLKFQVVIADIFCLDQG